MLIRVKLEGEKAVFSIADNGCGIPKEQINDLFTGYLDRKGTRADCKKSNMGIGLSVCAANRKSSWRQHYRSQPGKWRSGVPF